MPELQFSEEVLARLHADCGAQFNERAFLFLLGSIEFLQARLDQRRHVTGQELAWACRDFALQNFGLLSRTVLEEWGIRETADFGRIVFALVGVGLLSTQPGDRPEDFENVYEFGPAFDDHYSLSWQPEA